MQVPELAFDVILRGLNGRAMELDYFEVVAQADHRLAQQSRLRLVGLETSQTCRS